MSVQRDSTIPVRAVHPSDYAEWIDLYHGYRDFYGKPHNQEAVDTVWAWLNDPGHETRGLVAELNGTLVGLANFRAFARPLAASTGLFLDDLFTAPHSRGLGVGTSLLHALAEVASQEGATVVRWITAADNATARSVYDRESQQTSWVTYDLLPLAE